ncbi:MAG: carboxypeptidase regulatory-like domain-containing protein [Caldilineaceae bacterium]
MKQVRPFQWLLYCGVIIFLSSISLFTLPAVWAQTNATIQGRITNAADEPIMGAAIYAYQQDEQGQWVSIENDYSDFDGNYAITPLSAGAYRLKFEAPFNSNYFDKFHPNAETVETAADIPISAGQTLTIDTVLQQGATIQGKVINSAGAPIKGAYIYAYRLNTQGEWDSVASDFTNFDENYSITPLLAGTYRLRFDAPYDSDYLDKYYLNAETVEAATDIPLTAGQVITIDTTLQNSGHIAGKITNQAGTPIADASVTTYYQATDGKWTYGGSHKSNATGDYNIGGLRSKAYRLEIDPPFGSAYLAEYYDNAVTVENATNIAVSAGITTPINVKLEAGGTVAGRVTNKQGAPIADVLVYLYRRASEGDWSTIRSVRTNASGDYTIQGLTAGNYRVKFEPPFQSSYIGKFYENASDLESATDLAVSVGQLTTVNTTLVEGGRITGKVLNRAGAPLAGIEVTLYNDFLQCGAGYAVSYIQETPTDANGLYTISGLQAGLYRLQFDDPNKQYKTTYYPTANKLENATDLTVALEQTLTNLNVTLDERNGGTIAGKVTNAGGVGLARIEVDAYQYNQAGDYWAYVDATATITDGAYLLAGLAADNYRLRFTDERGHQYVTTYYGGAEEVGNATNVPVVAGQTSANVNITLAVGGQITGKIDAYADAAAYRFNATTQRWQWVAAARSDQHGDYTIGGLLTGVYRVEFGDFGAVDEYYPDRSTIEKAQDLAVTAGSVITGINAELTPSGRMAITVQAPDKRLLRCIDLDIYRLNNDNAKWESLSSFSYSGGNGAYEVNTNLATGLYRVHVEDYSGAYAPQYYNNKATLEAADTISVTAGALTTGINFTLTTENAVTTRSLFLPLIRK